MPRKPARATGPRFVNHSYPSFYACYLLKSLAATPKGNAARTNYVGSTPNPPRRIRQHNGEITSGAWKTANRRPWVMQLIVHGFPSRMSALQFEWAFQNPWKARHLKQASFPKKGRFLKQNIAVARTMVASHPYNAMPLHIKLFTEEAKKYWDEASRSQKVPPLPPGLQVSVELEGVNGKSGNKGSGRQRPIDVTDTDFTTSHLRKNTNLLSSKIALECFFCREALLDYSSDPLSHVLCPSHDCKLVAHIHCMAEWFLHDSGSPLLVPRGGRCPSCVSYVLWGDVVKGSYRRAGGGAYLSLKTKTPT
ncbi:hypothetical protein DL96DRAFT_1150007 [Flagelloscypha sp. PMI_526]|nr:hypothetical protein DL96DRAFT_1150007 [Flagelloscypha sp. PMI_526]